MTADEAKRLMSKHGSQRKAAAAGVSRKVIRHALAQGAPAKVSGARPVQGRTLSVTPGANYNRIRAEFIAFYRERK